MRFSMSFTSTILDVSETGIVKLANKTVYRVPTGHINRAKAWPPGTEVIVERNASNPAWQFIMKNAATPQQWVNATPSGGVWDW
jgi:hypothetical protein